MNQILQTLQPPNPPNPAALSPTSKPSFGAVTGQVKTLLTWAQAFANWTVLRLQEIRTQVNSQVQSEGAILASAATITPTNPLHHVSGTAAITTITVPPGFSGNIWLIPDGLWTMTTGGNIAIGVTAVVDKVLEMTYLISTQLWYPSYLA